MSDIEYPLGAISSELELRSFAGKTVWIVSPMPGDYPNPHKFVELELGIISQPPERYRISSEALTHPRHTYWLSVGEAAPPFADGTYAFVFPNYWMAFGYAIRSGRLKQTA
jgi:hypothetical protein